MKKTYLIKHKYLDDDIIDKIMKKFKIWKKFDELSNTNPDFIHIDSNLNEKKYWKYNSKLRNIIIYKKNNIDIRNKHFFIKKLIDKNDTKLDKMIIKQIYFNLYEIFKNKNLIKKYKYLFKNNKIWIFKYIYGLKGKKLKIIKTYNEFVIFVNELLIKYNKILKNLNFEEYSKLSYNSKPSYFVDWTLQEYIMNPLLYKKKKFHIRSYFLWYKKDKNNKEGYLFNYHNIWTAKLPFKNENYDDKSIHQSKQYYTEKDISLNKLFKTMPNNKVKTIKNKLNYLFKNILDVIDNSCYSNDKSCYNLFGSDIMITDEYDIKFIELNAFPSYHNNDINNKKLNLPLDVFEGILDIVLNNNKVIDRKNKFIKI